MDYIYEYNTKIIDAIKTIYLINASDKYDLINFYDNEHIYFENYYYISELEKYLPRNQFSRNKNINVYSFKLNPEDHQPSGQLNYSMIDNCTLVLKLMDWETEKTRIVSNK